MAQNLDSSQLATKRIRDSTMKPYAASDFEEYRGLSKKDQEKRIVNGFLQRLGLTAFDITPGERPDAVVNFFNDGVEAARLACEIQALHADDGPSGSQLREFHARWIQIMERTFAALREDGLAVPYCTVWFRESSYDCLRSIRNDDLVAEFIAAGRQLRAVQNLTFPAAGFAVLNSILSELRVVDADGQGLLWWPSHLKSGFISPLDHAIINAVNSKSALAASFEWHGADERLLLLVAEGRGLTDVIGVAREIKVAVPPSTPFTWIALWDRFSEDVWTIFPEYGVICDGRRQLRSPQLLPQALQRFSSGQRRYPTRHKPR